MDKYEIGDIRESIQISARIDFADDWDMHEQYAQKFAKTLIRSRRKELVGKIVDKIENEGLDLDDFLFRISPSRIDALTNTCWVSVKAIPIVEMRRERNEQRD